MWSLWIASDMRIDVNLARLSRTARNLDSSFIDKAIGNMKERCRRLHEAKGRHFEEGGMSLL